MILAVLLLVVFLLLATGCLFFFFCFFVPALKSKYYGVASVLSAEKNVSYETEKEDAVRGDPSRRAVIDSAQKDASARRLTYAGLKNCAVFHAAYETEYHGFHGCAGFGDCMAVCHQKAIQLDGGIAVVTDLCDGCGACVSACPAGLISLAEKTGADADIPAKKHFTFWRAWYRMIQARSGRS